MPIHCDIVSAEEEIFHGEVEMVVASGETGDLGIKPKHTPLITRLKPGQVRLIHTNGEEQSFYVSGGILEVQPSVVTVLADTAIRAGELDEAAIRQAREEAQKVLSGSNADKVDIAAAQRQMNETMAQLQALERLRKNLKH